MPALEEEERGQEGERDHAQALLLGAVLGVVAAHRQAEDERRQHGLRVRLARRAT